MPPKTYLHGALRLGRELTALVRSLPPRVAAGYLVNVARTLPDIIRTRSLRPADARYGPDLIELPTVGLRWPAANLGLIRELVVRRVYEAVPGFSVHTGQHVVDLGANTGLFTCMAAAQGAHVLAIEAQPGFVDVIQANVRTNRLGDRVTALWGLVGSGTGVLGSEDGRNRASHMRGLTPPTLDLAAVLDAHGLDRVDLMKMDIEGSEFDLFSGPTPWLARVHRIVAEAHAHHGDVLALVARLRSAGFDVLRLGSDLSRDPSPTMESQFLFATRRGATS